MRQAALFLLLVPTLALSQYAGEETRDIKALSPKEVEQYRAGAGMGYAKSAELNHYPGPMHALELADVLKLTPEQQAATRRLMDEHKAHARHIGAKLVEAERAIEALFRSGKSDQAQLRDAVHAAGVLQAEYRLSHLETHRRMRALLTDEQVKRYDHARGYVGGDSASHRGHKH